MTMKHFKMNKSSEKEIYSGLDYYDYSDFDDDYYYDLIEEKTDKRSKRKRPNRKSSNYAHTFHSYIKDY